MKKQQIHQYDGYSLRECKEFLRQSHDEHFQMGDNRALWYGIVSLRRSNCKDKKEYFDYHVELTQDYVEHDMRREDPIFSRTGSRLIHEKRFTLEEFGIAQAIKRFRVNLEWVYEGGKFAEIWKNDVPELRSTGSIGLEMFIEKACF